MRRNIATWILVGIVTALIQSTVFASGSIRPGGSISPRDAYTQGKALTSLKNSLEARDEAVKPGTSDDEHIKVLDRDEQEMVHYYLKRRYKL